MTFKRSRPDDIKHASDADRIVLLFDLDCFYAQCERVRLGLEGENVCLALLQWNSVLAVTYPARKYGIQRGDSWDAVNQKHPDCWAIHLKVKTKQDALAKDAGSENDGEESLNAAYDRIYKLSKEQQQECRLRENKLRRNPSEGKACLERYRIASQRIFSVVLETCQRRLSFANGSSKPFILERASIDEFYLDITEYCHTFVDHPKGDKSGGSAQGNFSDTYTAYVGDIQPSDEAMRHACVVAKWIRQDVFQALGFTMSAGISTNKMMAKLAASYGKPNGQAVLVAEDFEKVLATTKVRKLRNFGGKLGKQVQRFLNAGEDATMGMLQSVPLPKLEVSLGKEQGRFVFEAARGIDKEQVQETQNALVKSITAFKSFASTSSLQEVQGWLRLLAAEIVERVQTDAARHGRYPRSCTLCYSYVTEGSTIRSDGSLRQNRASQSARLAYPSRRQPEKIDDLVMQGTKIIQGLLMKNHQIGRIGLSAGNFDEASSDCKPITTFFSQNIVKNDHDDIEANAGTASLVQNSLAATSSSTPERPPVARILSTGARRMHEHVDSDMELAKKLQASFDRESRMLAISDQNRMKNVSKKPKVARIDSFFKPRG